MKLTRSIVIFPQFGNSTGLIQNIRQQYDPLATKIAPHITLVFPFKSEISSDKLQQHLIHRLDGFKSFNLCLQGISQEEENYLFLNLIQGREQITKIHDLVYSGILEQFLSKKHIYNPHLTLGCFKDRSATQMAINKLNSLNYKFETHVNIITTEIILKDSSSKIDFILELA